MLRARGSPGGRSMRSSELQDGVVNCVCFGGQWYLVPGIAYDCTYGCGMLRWNGEYISDLRIQLLTTLPRNEAEAGQRRSSNCCTSNTFKSNEMQPQPRFVAGSFGHESDCKTPRNLERTNLKPQCKQPHLVAGTLGRGARVFCAGLRGESTARVVVHTWSWEAHRRPTAQEGFWEGRVPKRRTISGFPSPQAGNPPPLVRHHMISWTLRIITI